MKFTHRPLEVEAEPYKAGMEEGLLAIVQKNRSVQDRVYFPYPDEPGVDVQQKIRCHRHAARITETMPAVVICGIPIPIKEGDWLLTHPDGGKTVLNNETLESLYEIANDNGKQNEEAEAVGREHKEEDRKEPPRRQVRQGRPPKAKTPE